MIVYENGDYKLGYEIKVDRNNVKTHTFQLYDKNRYLFSIRFNDKELFDISLKAVELKTRPKVYILVVMVGMLMK